MAAESVSAIPWMYPADWTVLKPDPERREDNRALWEEMFFAGGPSAAVEMIQFAPPGGDLAPTPLAVLGTVLPAKHGLAVDEIRRGGELELGSARERCVFCKLAFGSTVTVAGITETVNRNPRNPMYCDSCSWLITHYPGSARGPAIVLALDMRASSSDRQLDSHAHREKLLAWKHQIVQRVHVHFGFMHSTIADHAIAVWFPGFLPIEERRSSDALSVSAAHAFEAAETIISLDLPVEFRLGLDAADDMDVFANQLVGDVPLGPVHVDMSGEAIEVAVDIAENKPPRSPESRYLASSRFLELAGKQGREHFGPVSRHEVDAWLMG